MARLSLIIYTLTKLNYAESYMQLHAGLTMQLSLVDGITILNYSEMQMKEIRSYRGTARSMILAQSSSLAVYLSAALHRSVVTPHRVQSTAVSFSACSCHAGACLSTYCPCVLMPSSYYDSYHQTFTCIIEA